MGRPNAQCGPVRNGRTRTTKIGILLGQALPGHNETTVGSDGIGGDGRGIRLIRRRRFRLLYNRSGESRERNSQYQGGEGAKQTHGRTSLSAVVPIGMPQSWPVRVDALIPIGGGIPSSFGRSPLSAGTNRERPAPQRGGRYPPRPRRCASTTISRRLDTPILRIMEETWVLTVVSAMLIRRAI